MQQHDWLYNYISEEGIQKSFGGLVYRAKYLQESTSANKILRDNYSLLQSNYDDFFPELKAFATVQLSNLEIKGHH